jgi:hypothetical protein
MAMLPPLGSMLCMHLPGNGRDILQNHQSSVDLAAVMGDQAEARDGNLRIHQ